MLRAGEREEEVRRRVEVAIEGCFAIEGCLPQDVLKWPKKLPAEAGNFGTFFSHKIIPLLQARVGWSEAEFRSRYWRRTVGEARSSLDLKLVILDRNQDIRWSVGSSLDLSVLALRGSIQVPRSFLVECSNNDQAGFLWVQALEHHNCSGSIFRLL